MELLLTGFYMGSQAMGALQTGACTHTHTHTHTHTIHTCGSAFSLVLCVCVCVSERDIPEGLTSKAAERQAVATQSCDLMTLHPWITCVILSSLPCPCVILSDCRRAVFYVHVSSCLIAEDQSSLSMCHIV